MKVRKPTQKETWIGLISSVLIATGYFGWEKVTPVTHEHRSTENILRLIDNAVEKAMNHHVNNSGRH